MNHARETQVPISWHCVVAAACTTIWFLSLVLFTAIILFVLPKGIRESPLIALVPIVLFLSLTFGATLAASIITSKRAAAGQRELLSRILDAGARTSDFEHDRRTQENAALIRIQWVDQSEVNREVARGRARTIPGDSIGPPEGAEYVGEPGSPHRPDQ